MRRYLALPALGLLVVLAATAAAGGKDDTKPRAAPDAAKLAALIDRHVGERLAKEKVTASADAGDPEFLRRAFLDLTGHIPTASRAAAFLEDRDPTKRAKLIDELLASKEYGTHFATIWRDLMLRPDANMIRPPDTEPFVAWLAGEFAKGSGWDAIVTDMLTVEGTKPEGVFTILNGNSRGYPQANVLAGSVGTLFMGVQMACAECHHHPFIDAWKQEDFWGVAAFFGNVKSSNATNKAKGLVGVTEGKGVVDKKRNEAPVMKGTAIVIPDSSFKQIGKSVEAHFPQTKAAPMKMAGNYRPVFAKWLVSKDNPFFAKNAVNRAWAQMMGRGFSNPVGEISDSNPPSHPALLDAMAKDFAENGFDLKHLFRSIALSKTYQRSSRPNDSNKNEEQLFARQEVKVLSPAVLYTALTQALEVGSLAEKAKAAGGAKKKAAKGPAVGSAEAQKKAFLDFFTTKEVGGDATEYSHGIPQALRLMNQELFNTGGNAVERVAKAGGGHAKAVEGLYLVALSRRPTAEETKEMVSYVEKQKAARDGYRGVFWALLNSAEFMLNR